MDARYLAAGLAQGLAGALGNYQQMKEDDRKRTLEDAETAFRMGDLDGAQRHLQAAGVAVDLSQQRQAQAAKKAEAMRSALAPLIAGNPQAVASQIPAYYDTLSAATDLNLAGPKISGQAVTAPAPRPTPEMQGPMPLQTTHNFNNPQTQSALYAALGITPPKANLIETSPGASLFDPNAGRSVFTAPYPVNPNTQASLETRERIADRTIASRENIAQTNEAGRAARHATPRATSGRSGSGRTTPTILDYQEDGTAVVVPKTPGRVVRSKPSKPPTPKPAKEFDEAAAWRVAEKRFQSPTGMATKKVQEERAAYVEKQRKAHAAKQGGKSLEDILKAKGLL